MIKNLKETDWLALKNETPNAVMMDVRSPEEWAEGIIPEASLLNIMDPQNFVAGLDNLNKEDQFFIYCRSGARSMQACQIMEQYGFSNVVNLEGGILGWTGDVIVPEL